jgi:hypothetical protein
MCIVRRFQGTLNRTDLLFTTSSQSPHNRAYNIIRPGSVKVLRTESLSSRESDSSQVQSRHRIENLRKIGGRFLERSGVRRFLCWRPLSNRCQRWGMIRKALLGQCL